MNYQRLPLETTFNTRDLGGIPTKDNNLVSWKKLLRSDDVCKLSTNDIEFLENYGVGVVIDLRTISEREKTDYPLEKSSKIINYHIPFVVDETISNHSKTTTDMTLYTFYEKMLCDQQMVVNKLFLTVHESGDKGILFHCAAGKDRTGMLALLLLGLLNVKEEDIIANYETSYTYLSANEEFISLEEGYEHLMYSDRKNMEKLLQFISEKYGTVYQYLKECCLSDAVLMDIKNNLTQSGCSF